MTGGLRDRRIAVIGAGVAGLTAALALGRAGASVTVHERAGALREVGAGLQISPNARRVLDALGLGEAFAEISLRAEAVELRDQAGRSVAKLDLLRNRPSEAFRFVHRARLVAMLEAKAGEAGVEIRLGDAVTKPPADAALTVAADGLHSVQRARLNGAAAPFFTGQTAWRALIPAAPEPRPIAQVFMGPGRHLVSYPLAGGYRNIVAVLETRDWAAEGWSQAGDADELRAAFAGFGGPVSDWLSGVDDCGFWGLFRHPVAPHWQDANRVLIGDAAHPTLPFLAQGACMAIEDAWVLAATLDADADQARALARFEAMRKPRVARLIDAANRNARNYHLTGPARAAAHLALRGASRFAPATLFERFAWVYDYDPTVAPA